MSFFRTLTLSVVSLGVVGVGCGSDDPAQLPPDIYATEQQFCEELGKAICNANVVSACYGSDESSLTEDTAKCVENAANKACNPGNHRYNRPGAETCINQLALEYQDGKISHTELEATHEACLAAFSDGGAVGSDCTIDDDCDGVAGLRCVAKPGQDGTCQKPVVGDDCDADDAVCADGEYCAELVSGGYTCDSYLGLGATCSETALCDPEEALCVTDVMMMSTCEAKTDNGQACTEATQCKGGFCVRPIGAMDGTCAATLTLSPTDDVSCTALLP
jgi:hypothetical protein